MKFEKILSIGAMCGLSLALTACYDSPSTALNEIEKLGTY